MLTAIVGADTPERDWQPAAEPALTAALLAAAGPGTWCMSTWDGDGHPDHEAVGRAVRAAV